MKKALGWLSLYAVSLFAVMAGAWPAPASASAGANMWHANSGSSITGNHTATMTGGNTSIETTGAFEPFEAGDGDVLSLSYSLEGGATCIGGAPRVFAVVDGVNFNSWNQHIGDGVDAACAGDVTLPDGQVTALGIVWDNGQTTGTVQVTGLSIGEKSFNFNEYTVEVLTSVTAPTATAPTCQTAGVVTVPEQTGVVYKSNTADGKTTVTAEAKFGYEIKSGVTTTWTFPVAELTGAQCEASESPSPSPSTSTPGGGGNPSQSPSGSASPTGSATGSPSASSSPTSTLSPAAGAVGGSDSGSLPTTGPKVLVTFGVGGLLVAVGGLMLVRLRSRRDGAHREDGDTQVMPAI